MSNDPKFVLSYSHFDTAAVQSVRTIFDQCGVEYFVDEKDIEFSDDIETRVDSAIHGATHIFVYISPASLKSHWVLIEIGMAKALRKPLVCFLSHAKLDLPSPLAHIKYMTDMAELEPYLRRLKSASNLLPSDLSPLERLAWPRMYHYPGGHAAAIRLLGADDDLIPASRCLVSYTHALLQPPFELIAARDEFVRKKRQHAIANGQVFFNGPNARLLSWRGSPRDGAGSAKELVHLDLELGPVGWYDFEGLNEAFRETINIAGTQRAFETYLGWSDLLDSGNVSHARLSNILDNAVTLLTSDGYLAYQRRGLRVASVPNRLSSAVAENVNRYLDEAKANDHRNRAHSWNELESIAEDAIGEDYRPEGVPHPFAAAERGLAWEVSPRLVAQLQPDALRLTGLSFDLEALHPNALFMLALDLTRDELVDLCTNEPGREWYEGRLLFMPADLDEPTTRTALNQPTWVPAGKASVLRAFEVLRALRTHTGSLEQAIQQMIKAARR